MLLLLRTALCRHPLRLTTDGSAVKALYPFGRKWVPAALRKKISGKKGQFSNDLAAGLADCATKI
jgi:hypothetical protein